LDKYTGVPPLAAGWLRVIVAVTGLPPVTVLGLSVNVAVLAAWTVIVVVTEWPDGKIAVSVTVVSFATEDVDTRKRPVLDPPATGVLDGTLAAALFEDNATLTPPAGAAALSVTVPIVLLPLTTVAWSTAIDVTRGDNISSFAILKPPLGIEPLIVTTVSAATTFVVTVKWPTVCPAGITTCGGTGDAAPELLVSVTVVLVAEVAARVTVPLDGWLPVTVVGLKVTKSAGGLTTIFCEAVSLTGFAGKVTVITDCCGVATVFVVPVNVTEVEPAGTVATKGVTRAFVLLLDKENVTSKLVASFIVIFPVTFCNPPYSAVGAALNVNVRCRTVTVTCLDTDPVVAVTVAAWSVDTTAVLMSKFALTAPAGTVIDAGTGTLALLDVRVTLMPVAEAGAFRLTVP